MDRINFHALCKKYKPDRSCLNMLLIIVAVLIQVCVINGCGNSKKNVSTQEEKHYVCSMHPQVLQDHPGDCPICGMMLIEKMTDNNPADSSMALFVNPVNQTVIADVATVIPSSKTVPLKISVTGTVKFDPGKVITVSARFGGLIEKSFVKYQFQQVRKGVKIYEIFSPDIYSERWNYVKLIQAYPDQDNLTVEARQWLSRLGLTKAQIDSLKRTPKPNYHLPVYSEATGYAVSPDFDADSYLSDSDDPFSGDYLSDNSGIGFNEGNIVETGRPLFKLVDIHSLVAELIIRVNDSRSLRAGQHVTLFRTGSPDRKIEAEISRITQYGEGPFRLAKVYFTDNDGLLIPGSKIVGTIDTGSSETLWLPSSAVANLGRNNAVFILTGNAFKPVAVKTGLHSGNMIEILSGIGRDTRVALNAMLLIDSDGLITIRSN